VLRPGEDARATSSAVPACSTVQTHCAFDCGSLHSALTSWALAAARCCSRALPHSTHGLNLSSGADEQRLEAAEACWVLGPSWPHSMHRQRSRSALRASSLPRADGRESRRTSPRLSISHRPAAASCSPSSWVCADWHSQECGSPVSPVGRCTARRAPCKTSPSAARRHALSRLPRSSPRPRTSSASSAKASSSASTRRVVATFVLAITIMIDWWFLRSPRR